MQPEAVNENHWLAATTLLEFGTLVCIQDNLNPEVALATHHSHHGSVWHMRRARRIRDEECG